MSDDTFGVLDPTAGIIVHRASAYDPGDRYCRGTCGKKFPRSRTRKAIGMEINCGGCLRYQAMKEGRSDED
jgi:hypothetical protein